MVCPNCRAAGAVVAVCQGCGSSVPAAASGQFGMPVQSGYAPNPTYPVGHLAAVKPVGNTSRSC